MNTKSHIGRLIIFIAFMIFSVFAIDILGGRWLHIYRIYKVIILKLVLCFILGIILNMVGRKASLKNIKFNPFYFSIFLVCILIIAVYYIFYSRMPSVILKHMDTAELFLALYAGANLPSAFLKVS